MNFSRLAPTMFFLLLLISAPFFIVQTKNDATGRVLADNFTVVELPPQIQQTLYSFSTFENQWVRYNTVNYTLQTGRPTGDRRSSNITIINNTVNIITGDWFTINFYNASNQQTGVYLNELVGPIGGEMELAVINSGVNYQGKFGTGLITIPTGSTYFVITGYRNYSGNTTPVFSFQEFTDNEISYFTETTFPSLNYYQIMENARTAEYANVFGIFQIIREIPMTAQKVITGIERFYNFFPNPISFVEDRLDDMTFSDIGDSWWYNIWQRLRGGN